MTQVGGIFKKQNKTIKMIIFWSSDSIFLGVNLESMLAALGFIRRSINGVGKKNCSKQSNTQRSLFWVISHRREEKNKVSFSNFTSLNQTSKLLDNGQWIVVLMYGRVGDPLTSLSNTSSCTSWGNGSEGDKIKAVTFFPSFISSFLSGGQTEWHNILYIWIGSTEKRRVLC